MTIPPIIALAHGAAMPRLGLGTWPMDDAEAERVIPQAIEAGYRLFDTAENYGNETGVGRGVRASGIPREEVFITTKFNAEWHGVDLVRQAFEASAARLGVDYIDLLLVHWPNPKQDRYVEAWQGLLRLLDDGSIRAAGVSNFKPAHLDRIIAETGVAPDLNQVELHPYTTRDATRAYDAEHGIVTQSWSPIAEGGDVLADPVIAGIATKLGRTPAQVILRWHLELGLVTIPKTSNPARMRENLAALDFELPDEDVAAISALDRGEAAATDSDVFGH